MAKQKIKVLFFIAGMSATAEEQEEMDKFSAKHVVCVRNASFIRDDDAIEPFDVVAGDVPPRYAEEAKLKKPPKEAPKPPKVDAGKVDKQSPAAPPAGDPKPPEGNQGDGGDPKPPEGGEGAVTPPETPPAGAEGEQTPPAGDVKPKQPEAKPGAGKGWKPNA